MWIQLEGSREFAADRDRFVAFAREFSAMYLSRQRDRIGPASRGIVGVERQQLARLSLRVDEAASFDEEFDESSTQLDRFGGVRDA